MRKISPLLMVFLLCLTVCVPLLFCDEKATPSPATATQTASSAGSDIAKMDQRLEGTKEIIKEKEKAVEEVKSQAAQAIAEKNEAEKEAQLKKEAVAVTKQEAAVLKKEAKTTSSGDLLQKSRELELKARKLEKEAALYNEKVGIAESKAQIALEQIAVKEERLENLQKALESLQKEKAEKTPFLKKTFDALAVILISLAALLALRLIIKIFTQLLIIKKQTTIGREAVLRIRTFARMFGWLAFIVILMAATFFILETFGVSVAPLIAGAGIVGIAFGFGGQYLIRDIISGFFILIEGQYRIDDVVKIGDYSGLVEDMNLRITILRDLESRAIIIPNGEIKAVINYTKEYAHALFDIGIAYKESVDRVMEVIKDIGKEMRADPQYGPLILQELEMLGVDNFTDSAVIIKFRIKTLPMKQWDVSREFRRRLKNRFDELGIEMPFPHRTIYWGNTMHTADMPKRGAA